MIPDGSSSSLDLRRIAFFCVTITAISVLVLVGRLAVLSAGHLQDAVQAEESGRWEEAIESYTGSIRNYFPGNPFSAQAIRGAIRIIDRYHEQGKIEPRKNALLDLRASLLSIHSFYQPFGQEFQFIERELQSASQ